LVSSSRRLPSGPFVGDPRTSFSSGTDRTASFARIDLDPQSHPPSDFREAPSLPLFAGSPVDVLEVILSSRRFFAFSDISKDKLPVYDRHRLSYERFPAYACRSSLSVRSQLFDNSHTNFAFSQVCGKLLRRKAPFLNPPARWPCLRLPRKDRALPPDALVHCPRFFFFLSPGKLRKK